MKFLKVVLPVILVLVLFGCARDLGISIDGTYLSLSLQLPESGTSEGSRLIYSESDELYISLTYPDGEVVEAEFIRSNEDSTLSVLVEDLTPANGVILYVSMGLSEYDLPLSDAEAIIDIKKGANSPSMITLEAISYIVSGTLTDDSGAVLGNKTFTVNRTDMITTDAQGHFSLQVSSENPDDIVTFNITNTSTETTYDLTRTNLYLLENREDLVIKASPEIYLDFYVSCGGNVLPGTTFEIYDGYYGDGGTKIASGIADSSGRVFYQDSDYSSSSFHETVLFFNDLYEEEVISTDGAPGALIDDVEMTPYIITYVDDSSLGMGANLYRFSSVDGTSESLDLTTFLSDYYYAQYTSCDIFIQAVTEDYINNKIFAFVSYVDLDYLNQFKILIFNGWSDMTPEEVTVTSALPLGETYVSTQQMTVLNDGNLLVATSMGSYIVDISNLSITHYWETDSPYAFVGNGGCQDSNGNIFILGVDRVNGTAADQILQKIWTVGTASSTDWTLESDLPSTYSDFCALDTTISSISSFTYLRGLYLWRDVVVSTRVHSGLYSGGSIIFLDPSTWNSTGTPVENKPEGGTLDVIRPIGLLPDNKFYFIEDVTSGKDRIIRMDDPSDTDLEIFDFYSNPSGGIQDYYFYIEGGW